jgi:hypothetical protein
MGKDKTTSPKSYNNNDINTMLMDISVYNIYSTKTYVRACIYYNGNHEIPLHRYTVYYNSIGIRLPTDFLHYG